MRLKTHRGISVSSLGILLGVAVVSLFMLYKELPALRRYVRIERM